jgi:hypothetical protein
MAAMGAGALGAIALRGSDEPLKVEAAEPDQHLAWVWQFSTDGSAARIRTTLADLNLGILLKTHDGQTWMGRWDSSLAHGPHDVASMAEYFESAGVPFHAWCVVKGLDPIAEAQMASEVLANGARSITFDLEPPEGRHYWQAGRAEAVAFGHEMRRLQPTAHLGVAPDARPWQLNAVPMAEFAGFCDEIMPQTYWRTFDNAPNYRLLAQHGFATPAGVTPELILQVAQQSLGRYGRPIRPIGQAAASRDEWLRFIAEAQRLGMYRPSFWRYGTGEPGFWHALQEVKDSSPAFPMPIRQSPQMPAAPAGQTASSPLKDPNTNDAPPPPQSGGALESLQTSEKSDRRGNNYRQFREDVRESLR